MKREMSVVRISCQCSGSIYGHPKLAPHVNRVSLLDPLTLDRRSQRKAAQATIWKEKVQAAANLRNALTTAGHQEGDGWSRAHGRGGGSQ